MLEKHLFVPVHGVRGRQRVTLGIIDCVCSAVLFPGFDSLRMHFLACEFPRDKRIIVSSANSSMSLVGKLRPFAFMTAGKKGLLAFIILLLIVLVHWFIGISLLLIL